MTFRERYNKWKAGELVYSAGRVLPKYYHGDDEKYKGRSEEHYKRAAEFLISNEGYKLHVYNDYSIDQKNAAIKAKTDSRYHWDPKAKKYYVPTSGIGWTKPEDLHDWTYEQAVQRLTLDLKEYDRLLFDGKTLDYNKINDNMAIALYDVMHQGGVGALAKMEKFSKAFNEGLYQDALNEFDFAAKRYTTRNNKRKEYFRQGIIDTMPIVATPSDELPVDNTRTSRNIMMPIARPEPLDVVYQNMKAENKAGFGYTLNENLRRMLVMQQYLNPQWQEVPVFNPSFDTTLQKPRFDSGKDLYVVKVGDTLTGIAHKAYGRASKYKDIAEYNNIENPDFIKVGLILNMPQYEQSQESSDVAGNQVEKKTEPQKKYGKYVVLDGDGYSDEFGNNVQFIGFTEDGRMKFRNDAGNIATAYEPYDDFGITEKRIPKRDLVQPTAPQSAQLNIPGYEIGQGVQLPKFNNPQVLDLVNLAILSYDNRAPEESFFDKASRKIRNLMLPVSEMLIANAKAAENVPVAAANMLGYGLHGAGIIDDGDAYQSLISETPYEYLYTKIMMDKLRNSNNSTKDDREMPVYMPDDAKRKQHFEELEQKYGEDVEDVTKMFRDDAGSGRVESQKQPGLYSTRNKIINLSNYTGTHRNGRWGGDFRNDTDHENVEGMIPTFLPFKNNWKITDGNIAGFTHAVAIAKDGSIHAGKLSDFKNGEMMSPCPHMTFNGWATDSSGKMKEISSAGNSWAMMPVAKTLDGKEKAVGILRSKKNAGDNWSYDYNTEGGSVLIKTKHESFVVSGTYNDIIKQISDVWENYKHLPFEIYGLDNGSYARGLWTNDRKITKEQLAVYDRRNPGGGGSGMIITKK